MRVTRLALLLILLARACYGASGTNPVSARGAALGGISTVGESASPEKVAVLPARGLMLETSWANPYGIDGLYVAAVSLRRHWKKASVAASMQSLNTPTPYGEVHLRGGFSLAAAECISIGAGADIGLLSDSDGVFAREMATCLGLALGRPEKWELGCAAIVPLSVAGEGGENGGFFRWGAGVSLADGLSVAVEEERRARLSVRRFGGELDVAGGVSLRAGVSGPPITLCLGLGVTRANTTLSLALAQHEVLGPTPYVTVSYGGSDRAAAKVNQP